MAKIIDVDVLDNFKLRQDAVNDAWFLKRSNIEKEDRDVKIVVKESSNPSTEVSYNVLTHESEIPAENIVGTIPLEAIPVAAQERLVHASGDNPSSWSLDGAIQKGDVVSVTSSGDNNGKMFFVVDENNLNNWNGYQEIKTVTTWDSIKGKPTSFTAGSHSHGKITNDGKISGNSATGVPVVINNSGQIAAGTSSTYASGTHAHGSITNAGKMSGTTTNGLPLVTKNSDGTIGVGTASTFASGTHTHGNINNNGTISGGSQGQVLMWSTGGAPVWGTINTNTGSYAPASHTHPGTDITSKVSSAYTSDYASVAGTLQMVPTGETTVPIYFDSDMKVQYCRTVGGPTGFSGGTYLPIRIPVSTPNEFQPGMIWIES